MELIQLVNSVMIFVTQTILLRSLIFLHRFLTVTRKGNLIFCCTGLTDTNFRQIKITKILKSLKILKTILEAAPKIFKGLLLIFMIYWISWKSVFVSFRTLNFDISKALTRSSKITFFFSLLLCVVSQFNVLIRTTSESDLVVFNSRPEFKFISSRFLLVF